MPRLTYPRPYLEPRVRTDTPISPTLTLLGYSLHGGGPQSEAAEPDGAQLQPGSPVTIDLFWHSLHPDGTPSPAEMVVALDISGDGHESLLWEGPIAPGARWPSDHAYCSRIRTALPDDLSPGEHHLGLRWTLSGEQRAELGTLAVGPSTRLFEPPPLVRTVDALLSDDQGGQIRLLGLAELAQEQTDQGEALVVTLVWQEDARVEGNYKAFLHLLNAEGTIVAQSDSVPAQGYATNRWVPDEVVVDRHLLALPDGLPAGAYTLVAGLYEPIGGRRLTIRTAAGEALPHDLAPLGEVTLPISD